MTDVDDFIAHFGRKGMKWGVVSKPDSYHNVKKPGSTVGTTGGRAKGSADSSGATKDLDAAAAKKALRVKRAKQAAVGVGILAAVAGTAYVAHQMNQNGGLKVGGLGKPSPKVTKKVEKIQQQPNAVMHIGRGKHQGFGVYRDGGLDDFLPEYDRAFPQDVVGSREVFRRYGDNNEKVAARFLDPEGRRDAASRVVPHEVIIPKSMAATINNIDDVKTKIWPRIKDQYAENYENEPAGKRK